MTRRKNSTITRFMHHRRAMIGGIILVILVGLSLLAPVITQVLDVSHERVDIFNALQSPSWEHPLGTDSIGRDVLARLLYGGRISLMIGLISVLIVAVIGGTIGLISGYVGGQVDIIMMRITDSIIALPLLPLLIVLSAIDVTILGIEQDSDINEWLSVIQIIVVISIFGWTTIARLIRGVTLSVKARLFVLAAEAIGASPIRVMVYHILPEVISPLIIASTLAIGNIILLESVLSFLGLGVQPPIPSWGSMLTNAQDVITTAPLLAVYPGLLIFLTVMAFNLVGDALQEILDPRIHSSPAAD